MQANEIHDFCAKHGIQNYKITPHGVDISQDIRFHSLILKEFPFQFNEIHGDFKSMYGNLESLKNGPHVVHGTFDVTSNNLTSLLGCPKVIKGAVWCSNNHINMWEHRYLLFSEVQKGIFTEIKEINLILKKYQNKKNLIPQALKELRSL